MKKIKLVSPHLASPKPWWTQEPLRIVEICNMWDFEKCSLKNEVKEMVRLKGNVQHFHCMSMQADERDGGGTSDDRLFFKTSLARKQNPDRLKEYLPLAKRHGIRVIVYFNVHWYSPGFGKRHPEWRQIREDGAPINTVYSTGTSCCVNGPWREWAFQIVRDLCRYEIDGIFYDGPIFFDNTCYCPACRRLFKEKTGQDLPSKGNPKDSLWKDLVDFQKESIGKFLGDTHALIRALGRDILLYMNGNCNWPYWTTGRDNTVIIENTDILGGEGGFVYGDLNKTPIYKPGIAAKLLSVQARGKPSIGFDCAGHKPWSWYLLPEQELKIMLAETLAGGGNYWIPFYPDNLNQKESLDVVAGYNDLLEKDPDPFFNSHSLARVALIWPDQACNYYRGASVPLTDFTRKIEAKGVGDISDEFHGFYEALVRTQTPFDVIDEKGLHDLRRYDLVILPNAPSFQPAGVSALKNFVEAGGCLVGSFETSLYNTRGDQERNFTLAEWWGADYTGEIFGPMNWDYLSAPAGRPSPILEGITQKYIPSPRHGIKVKPTTAKVALYYCGRLKGCYEHAPVISEEPFLLMNKRGKGLTCFFAGTFGWSLCNYRFPEHLQLVRNLVRQHSKLQVEVENAPEVEVTLKRKNETTYLHLINHTGGLKRPLIQSHPLKNLSIHLKLKAKKARTICSSQKLNLCSEKGGVRFVLPKLDVYEVIELF